VVRLDGLPWLVAPPAAAARRDAEIFVASARLAEHPPVSTSMLAADVLAILTDLHPFPDGNGRVARALATWLPVRSAIGSILNLPSMIFFARVNKTASAPSVITNPIR
jgi:hypothetical protein